MGIDCDWAELKSSSIKSKDSRVYLSEPIPFRYKISSAPGMSELSIKIEGVIASFLKPRSV